MMKILNRSDPLERAFFIIGGICCAILLILIAGFTISVYTMDSEELVSGPLDVSSEWVEVSPKHPMKPLKENQQLVVVVDSTQRLAEDRVHSEPVRMADGTPLHVDIQLLDPDGNIVDLKPHQAPNPSLYENAITGSPVEERTYVKVRLKSDRPLRVSRIVWHCWTGK